MRTDGHIFILQLEYWIEIHQKAKLSILPRKFPEDENLAQVRERLISSPGELTNMRYESLHSWLWTTLYEPHWPRKILANWKSGKPAFISQALLLYSPHFLLQGIRSDWNQTWMIQLTPLSDRLTKRFQPAPYSVEVYSCVAIGHVHCVCTYDIFIFATKLF